MNSQDPDVAPHPASIRDLGVLIGWLAEFEGHLMADGQDPGISEQFRNRFVQAGLLARDADGHDFRQAINDMNHRLRYAIGEYPAPPNQMAVAPPRQPAA